MDALQGLTSLLGAWYGQGPRSSGALGSNISKKCPVRDSNPPHRIKSPALYQMS
jgi:hypothetical protein